MAKRDTYMTGPAPYYRGTSAVEAAKHLANVARRYAQEKATRADVDEAIGMWRDSDWPPVEPPRSDGDAGRGEGSNG